jgi:hypothetical protein
MVVSKREREYRENEKQRVVGNREKKIELV